MNTNNKRLYVYIDNIDKHIKDIGIDTKAIIEYFDKIKEFSYHGMCFSVVRHYMSNIDIPPIKTDNYLLSYYIPLPQTPTLEKHAIYYNANAQPYPTRYDIYYEGHYEPNLYTGWYHFIPHTFTPLSEIYGSLYPKSGNSQKRDASMMALYIRTKDIEDTMSFQKYTKKTISKMEIKRKLKYYHYYKSELDKIGYEQFIKMKLLTILYHLNLIKYYKNILYHNKGRIVVFPSYQSIKNLKYNNTITMRSYIPDKPLPLYKNINIIPYHQAIYNDTINNQLLSATFVT